jgi:PilZ domain
MEMSFSMIKARIGETPDPAERRREARVPVKLDARVRELGANGVEARVLNISESGFMAETDAAFEVGSRIWLMLPGRDRANAVVKWVAGDKIGAEFTEPMPLEDLRTDQDDA